MNENTRTKIGSLKYRILFVILIIAIFLLYYSYPCLKLSLSGIPERITQHITSKTKALVFLYGGGICGTCPQGRFLFSLRNRPDILFIVPEEYSDNDKENLGAAFSLKGKIISGDEQTREFFEMILRCSNKKTKKNYYAELDSNKEIKGGKLF